MDLVPYPAQEEGWVNIISKSLLVNQHCVSMGESP